MLLDNRCEVENEAVCNGIKLSRREEAATAAFPPMGFSNAFGFTTMLPKTEGQESNISD